MQHPHELSDSQWGALAGSPQHWLLIGGIARESALWIDGPKLLLARLRRLDPQVQLHLLDLPGTGALWRERSPSHVAELVENLRKRVKRLEGPVGLIASSGSTGVATEWARRYPEEVGALVLLSPAMRPFTSLIRAVRPSLWPTLMALVLGRRSPLALNERWFASTTHRRAEDVEVLDSEWQRLHDEHPVKLRNAFAQGLAIWRYQASRRRPMRRILLLAGHKDKWFDWRISQAISRAWGAALRVHPDAGHDLLLDDPDWVAQSLADWLQPVGQSQWSDLR
ncbi:pimeloyl-ACP methyl ester carboxylesterase [Inhella inkyongensis]|uniref:Pimeloyl-ACP methyl ester carboxylesterase n=1 Tax=Inhella inkyongensis TaxID=392593 RepID=A0A840S9B0_9BURK|nr:alpha/beta hydrolase [Inhella inkyongensis]MBB5206118.1 pimeloyl-ACP methyl ester carboxylesterase [Inhella inkyongensis]